MRKLIFAFFIFVSFAARADWSSSDDVSIEIQKLASEALAVVEGHESHTDQVVAAMRKQLPLVRAYMTEEKLVADSSGQSQDSVAMNFPQLGLILINRARWSKITSVPFRRAIALHEVASLIHLESTGVYTLSSDYIALAGLSAQDFLNAISTESKIQTADGLIAASCSWTSDRLNFFFEVWTSSVETCEDKTGIANTVASFKERRLREAMRLATRNCAGDEKVLSDISVMTSLVPVYKKQHDPRCTQ